MSTSILDDQTDYQVQMRISVPMIISETDTPDDNLSELDEDSHLPGEQSTFS